MKRAAIIGLGAISAVHVAAITENDFADIIAICDIDAEKLVKTAAKIPHPVRTYTDYKAMLAEFSAQNHGNRQYARRLRRLSRKTGGT